MKRSVTKPQKKRPAHPPAEIFENRSSHLQPSGIGVKTVADKCAEIFAAAGRFTLPDTRYGLRKQDLKNPRVIGKGAHGSFVFDNLSYPIPPAWQWIINYLHEEGLIERPAVALERFFHDTPPVFSARLRAAFREDRSDGRKPIRGYSHGVSFDFEEALSKAVGELLERYFLTLYKRENLIKASPRDLTGAGKNHLDIRNLAGFSNTQKKFYPRRQWTDKSILFWVEGAELLSNTPALLPAQLVFWNYKYLPGAGEPFLQESNTNGCAGHFTRTEAILEAIYENIQRDAFLIYWLNALAPPRISAETIENEELRKTLQDFSDYGLETVFLNTTLDCRVPSCIAVLLDHTGIGPKVSVGGGCSPNMERAMLRSLIEAFSVYYWVRTMAERKRFTLGKNYKPFTSPSIDQEKRLLLWGNIKMFPKFKHFLGGRVQSFADTAGSFPPSFPSPDEELHAVLEVFQNLGEGYEVFIYEARHKVLESIGFHSVTTIIPKLIPLYLREADAPLGATRLKEVPTAMGHAPRKTPYPYPHPFP